MGVTDKRGLARTLGEAPGISKVPRGPCWRPQPVAVPCVDGHGGGRGGRRRASVREQGGGYPCVPSRLPPTSDPGRSPSQLPSPPDPLWVGAPALPPMSRPPNSPAALSPASTASARRWDCPPIDPGSAGTFLGKEATRFPSDSCPGIGPFPAAPPPGALCRSWSLPLCSAPGRRCVGGGAAPAGPDLRGLQCGQNQRPARLGTGGPAARRPTRVSPRRCLSGVGGSRTSAPPSGGPDAFSARRLLQRGLSRPEFRPARRRETPSSSLLRCLRLYQGDARNSAQLAEQDAEGQAEHREHFPGHEGASGETGPRTVPKAAGPACRVPCPSRVRRAGRCQEQGPEGGPEARPRPG